jgi:hypothetical protein
MLGCLLLLIAGTDLARSRRLFDARPSCWPVIHWPDGVNHSARQSRRRGTRLG